MIVIGTTTCAAYMDQEETWSSWMLHGEEIRSSWPDGVHYFAALETDARGLEPFKPFIARLEELEGTFFDFRLDDGRTEVTTANRLRHITMGQNIIMDFACSLMDCTHVLHLAADLEPDPRTLPELVAMDWPIVGGFVSTYGLRGPRIKYPEYVLDDEGRNRVDDYVSGISTRKRVGLSWSDPVEIAMATAAYVMLRRDLFRRLRFRWDVDCGMTDDPCLQHDAKTYFGWETMINHKIKGKHHPETIPAVEGRGHDLRVER